MFQSSFLALVLLISSSVFAQDLSYTYIQGAYEIVEVDPLDIDGDGLGLDASFALTDRFYLIGSYGDTSLDFDVDLTRWTAGAGFHFEIANNLDLFAEAAYINLDADGPVVLAEDDGLQGRVGLRSNFGGKLELQGAVRYDDLSEEFSYDAGLLVNFNKTVSLGIFGVWEDEVTTYRAGVRLNF